MFFGGMYIGLQKFLHQIQLRNFKMGAEIIKITVHRECVMPLQNLFTIILLINNFIVNDFL